MTQYLVCPHCRTVTPIAPERTISEAVYNTWVFVRGEKGRLSLHSIMADMNVSYSTVHRHINALADAGLVKRMPQGGFASKRKRHWYEIERAEQEQLRGEQMRDAGAMGEGTDDHRAPVHSGA